MEKKLWSCLCSINIFFSPTSAISPWFLSGVKIAGKKGENPRSKKSTEPPCPPGMTHTLTHTHTFTHTCIQLTHSTSLTKPRGSFSGDKFSRNPVIMTAPLTQNLYPAAPKLWMLVQQGGKRGSCLTEWRGFTADAAKNGQPKLFKASFTSQLCAKSTKSNFSHRGEGVQFTEKIQFYAFQELLATNVNGKAVS